MVDDPGGTPLSQKITFSNASKAITPEGTNVLSTGEGGGSKFLREDGDGTSSWQAIPGGGDALTASPLSQFAATTSLQLKGVISDETGSGALAFADTPTLVTPVLGVATATSVNKVAITAPATSATITATDGTTTTLSGGTHSGTNTGDQTSIVGVTGTKAQFDTAVTDGNFMYIGDAPTAHTHLLAAGATDVTASAAELNILDGATLDVTELNYVDGVTSAIQTQLNAKQASGATLSSLEGLTLGAGDLLYATAADTLTDLAIGTANQVLAVNAGATAPEWKTVSSGGQTTYDAIVASSGGDYTTLGAAIAAASNGWRILIKTATTETGTITSSLTGLHIEGYSKSITLDLATYVMTLSGVNCRITGMGITYSTGKIILSGKGSSITNCYISTTSAGNNNITLSGGATVMADCVYSIDYSSTGGAPYVFASSNSGSKIVNNHFIMTYLNNNGTTTSTVRMTASGTFFSSNTLEITVSSSAGSAFIQATQQSVLILGNTIYKTHSANALFATTTNADVVISNNTGFWYGSVLSIGGARNVVSSNKFVLGSTTSTIGIAMTSAAIGCTIVGNNIQCAAGASSIGISITDAASIENLIADNYIRDFVTGISITAGSANTVTSNVVNGATTAYVDTGTASTFANNTPTSAILQKSVAYMKNTSGGNLAAGDLVVYKAVAAGDEVTTTTTAGDDKVYGMATAAITSNTYGYIQTLGKTTLLKVDGTTDIAIGDPLTAFTTAGIAAKAAAGEMVFAYALEAYTTNDSLGVIDALLISPRLI